MEEPQEDDTVGVVHAIIYSGGLKLIAEVSPFTKPGNLIILKDAYELHTSEMHMMAPGGGRPITIYSTETRPLDNAKGPVTIMVQVHGIRLFRDMNRDEADEYIRMTEETSESLRIARAKALGIEIPVVGGRSGIVPGRS